MDGTDRRGDSRWCSAGRKARSAAFGEDWLPEIKLVMSALKVGLRPGEERWKFARHNALEHQV